MSAAQPVTYVPSVFTPDELREIEAQVQRVILAGCGWGELRLIWQRGELKGRICAEDVRVCKAVENGAVDKAPQPVYTEP